MFNLVKIEDGMEPETLGTYNTREEALQGRITEVSKWLHNLEADGYVDKYGVEDWSFGAINCTDDSYYVDEKAGCEFNIVEV